jgi:PAS domain S-box-containing protein
MNRFTKPPQPANALEPCDNVKRLRATLPQVGTWEWDFASGDARWSDGLYHLLGIEPGTVPASYDLFLSKVHPEDRPANETAGRVMMTEGGTVDDAFRIIRADGAVRWMANKGEVFNDAAGKPSWAAGALFDITEIREAQLELAVREERYRALATVNSLGQWRATPDGAMIECEWWSAFTGQPADACLGHGWLRDVHPDDRDSLAEVWREAIRIGCSAEYSFRVRHHSGAYHWILAKAVPIKNRDGSVREWIGSDEDIHSRRKAEEDLRVNENRLRLALEAARTITWDYDIRTGYITRSPNAPDVLGFGSGSVEEFFSRIHRDDSIRLQDALPQTLENGDRYDFEYRIVDPFGRTRWLRARGELLRNARKRPDRMIGVTFDVTSEKEAGLDQRRTREELDELTARWHALGVATGGFVWACSPEGKVVDMPALREFTGFSLREIQGWGWLNAIHPADRERIREVMQSLIDGQASTMVDYRVRNVAGDYRWFRSRGAPVVRPDGSVAEWIGISEPLGGSPAATDRHGDARTAPLPSGPGPQLISGAQVRAARAIVNWSVRDLAEASGVSSSTIRRIEEDAGFPETRDARKLDVIRSTLESAGVEFLAAMDGKRGSPRIRGRCTAPV